jgi:putative endonuclease
MPDDWELWVYILRCSDNSYYVGSTKQDPRAREWEHNQGVLPGYTRSRRPVRLVYCEHYEVLTQGHDRERQLKGWSRAKKEALISRMPEALPELSRSYSDRDKPTDAPRPRPSTGSG